MLSIDLVFSRANSSGSQGFALQIQEQDPGCRASHALLKLTLDSVHLPGRVCEALQEWLPNLIACSNPLGELLKFLVTRLHFGSIKSESLG